MARHHRSWQLAVFALLGVWLLGWASPAPAQDAPLLRVDIVKGSAPRSTRLPDRLQEQESERRIPGNVTRVPQSASQGGRAATVKDLVDYVPGVVSQPRNGAESARLSIRGSGLARSFQGRGLLILQDGIPVNTADGSFEFPVIDPWLITASTVYRGANASILGASTLGGAIDFTTPTGVDDALTTLRAELGGFGDRHGLFGTGWQNKTTDGHIAVTGFSQAGFRDNNRQDTARLNGTIGWRSTPDLTQRLYINQTGTDAQIPGALRRGEIADDPRQANPLNRAGRYRRDLNLTRLGHRLAWESGGQRLESTLYYSGRYLDNPVTTYIKEHNNDAGWRGRYTRNIDLDVMTIGLNGAVGSATERRYANLARRTGIHILDRTLAAGTYEAYGQYDRHLAGALYGIAGLQGSYATRDLRETFPAARQRDHIYVGFNPRIGLRYDADATTQLFTNFSRSFEPPTWDELSGGNVPGFKDLKAQRAVTLEAGLRRDVSDARFELGVYRSQIRNEFVNYAFANGTTDTINAARSVHQGIELGVSRTMGRDSWIRGDSFTARAAYSWNDFRLADDPLYGNRSLPGVPRHILRSEMVYRHPAGLTFGPNVEWVPVTQPVDLAHSLHAAGYAVFGARAEWNVPDRNIGLYLEARNLADKHYAATYNVIPDARGIDGRYFYPGEGRAVYAGMQIRF